METLIKNTINLTIIIVWLLISIAETSYCQHSKADDGKNNDKGIVHNDKTGIVIDIIENDNNGKTVSIQGEQMGSVLISIPTKLAIDKGKVVIYREIKGDKGHNGKGNGNANANSNNDMCEIISVEN